MAEYDKVILRRWLARPYTIIALFPEQGSDGHLINSYEHIGQHGDADYDTVIERTRSVKNTEPDAQELIEELRSIGYNPLTYQRRTAAMRRKMARA